MAQTPTPLPSSKTDLQGLKRWIEARELHEASTTHPIPLTPAERKAINTLEAAAAVTQVHAGDDTGDWISILKMYQDSHPGVEINYSEAESAGDQLWRCYCVVRLPNASNSTSHPVEQPTPVFRRKKDAKQYAAKFAYLSLRETLAPAAGPVTALTEALPADLPGTEDQVPAVKRKREDKDSPAPERVTKLCAKLGMSPPKYEIEPAGKTGLWNGKVVMDVFQDVPRQYRAMDNIFASKKDDAKEQMAESLLEWLQAVEAEREKKL